MFSHVMVGTNDMEASRRFYDAVLAVLGHTPGVVDEKGRCFYYAKSGVFALTTPIDGQPATHANGGTIGFRAKTPELVDEFHAVGQANGGTSCEDPPGIRGNTQTELYLAYLRDPSGNKVCALHMIR